MGCKGLSSVEFAEKYGKSVPQICLRFLVQKGIIPLVKASAMERMKQNQDIFNFEISAENLNNIFTFENSLLDMKWFNPTSRRWEDINGDISNDYYTINTSNNTIEILAGYSVLLSKK